MQLLGQTPVPSITQWRKKSLPPALVWGLVVALVPSVPTEMEGVTSLLRLVPNSPHYLL